MAEERIDIVVDDKVDGSIDKKLRAIADAADRGHSSVSKLKADLASINTSAVTKLQAASASMSNALARELTAQARLTTARGQASVADARAATEAQRLATETARTEAAQSRAAAAASRAAAASLSLESAQRRSAAATGDLAARADRLRSSLDPAYAAQMRFNAEINEANALLRAGVINMQTYQAAVAAADAKIKSATGAQDRFNTGLNNVNNTAGRSRANMGNLVAQFNDIGVSLASGQNPMLVFIQQGSQISYIAGQMEGGFKAVGAAALRMLAPFLPLIAVMSLLALAFKDIKDEAGSDAEMKKFAGTLGLTKDEMEKLKDVTVTWGDVFGATMDVIAERMGTTTGELKKKFSSAFSSITEFAKFSVAIIYAAFFAGFRGIARIILGLPGIVGEGMVGAVNLAIAAIEGLINLSIAGLNKISDGINGIFGTSLGRIADVSLKRMANKFAGTSKQVAGAIKGDLFGGFNSAMGIMDDISERAGTRAEKRMRDQAKKLIEDRKATKDKAGPKPKVDNSAEQRAHALDMVNLKLDDELKRMKLLKDERAVQQRMDQIEEQLAQKKIKLNDQERASVEGKVRAIEAYKFVQSELDRIYEKVTAPQRTYNAALQATNELLAQGAITQQRASQETVLASRALAEANDPLFAMKENLTQAEAATKLYGDAVQRNNYYEQIRQAYLKDGIILGQNSTAAIDAEVAAMMRRNDAILQSQYVQQQVGAIIDPIIQDQRLLDSKAAMYAEIDRLRQLDVLSEGQAAQARAALNAKFDSMRLSQASSFFGSLAQLSSQGNKKLAAIGKAAAIAQATVDGVMAVQKALASAPPPVNFALAAAVGVAAAANVAKMISSPAGNFANGGQFMVDGRSGVDANNINMNVTRGERVTIETPAQQRANDNGGSPGNAAPANIRVVNVTDPRDMVAAMDSFEGEQVVMNVIRNRASDLRAILG